MSRFLLILLALMTMGCQKQINMDIQGHRGCRGLLPENSLPAFKKALELGVTTLEMDVVISKDGKVVVSHEPFLNHEIALDLKGQEISEIDERSYNLYEMTYDSIVQYDCGSKPHPRFSEQVNQKVYKPLLSEVIEMAEELSNNQINYNIEIKSDPTYDGKLTPNVDEFVRLVIDVIQEYAIEERASLQSFDIRAIEKINSSSFKGKIVLLIDENESIEDKLMKLSFKPDILSPFYELLSKDQVKNYHSKGFEVIPWTVNTEGDMQKMIDFGVDGIITDYPNRLIQLLQS